MCFTVPQNIESRVLSCEVLLLHTSATDRPALLAKAALLTQDTSSIVSPDSLTGDDQLCDGVYVTGYLEIYFKKI